VTGTPIQARCNVFPEVTNWSKSRWDAADMAESLDGLTKTTPKRFFCGGDVVEVEECDAANCRWCVRSVSSKKRFRR